MWIVLLKDAIRDISYSNPRSFITKSADWETKKQFANKILIVRELAFNGLKRWLSCYID